MREQLYIVSYNNNNYIFTINELVQEKINNKQLLINTDLNKYANINTTNINIYKQLINNIIKKDTFKVINYSINSSFTIYKIRYIIKKYIDTTLEYDKQHITFKTNTYYNEITEILFKLFGNNKEKIKKQDIIFFYKLIGCTIIEQKFTLTNLEDLITYNNIKNYLNWEEKYYITLGFKLININNNNIFVYDGNFNKKNIDYSIFDQFILYNTNNETLNDYYETEDINNYIINVSKYNITDSYFKLVSNELNKYNISYNEDIDIIYSNNNIYNLEKINFYNSSIKNIEIVLNNTINNFNLLQELNKYNVSNIIPFIRSKNNKNIIQYKIFIKNDIPFIHKDILELWINEENDYFKINTINLKVKYLNIDDYYNIIISDNKILFNFKNENLFVNDIKINIDYILKKILNVTYTYNIYNPLFTIKKCNIIYNYNINNINYNLIYLKLLFIISIFYTDTILDINYIKENISKLSNLKEINCYYKKSLNYKYPIDEMNILRDAKSIKQKKMELKKIKENIKYNFDIEEQLYKSAKSKINLLILYNNNNLIFNIKNILNINKLNDLNYIFNKYLLLISNDISLYNLYNSFNIDNLKQYELNNYNNIIENSVLYYNIVNKIYSKLNINASNIEISDITLNKLDDFFNDIVDINYNTEIIIPDFNTLINKKNKTILNINNGEFIINNIPQIILDNLNIKNNKIKILKYDNDAFKILLCLINLFIKINYKINIITFIEINNSKIFNYLNEVKKLFTLEIYINKILLITDYIKILNINIIDNIKHKILNNNIIEIYLYILDYEYILSTRHIIKYNKEIYKDFGFLKYNQYSQICEAKRQPIKINKNLYKILLNNDTTGSINRLFKNEKLTKYIAGKFYICLNTSTIEGKRSFVPIMDNITENIFSICCHTFDHKDIRKSNLQDIQSNKNINFTNTYMLPYNIANISSDEIVKCLGFEPNKKKIISNIYNIDILLRVGIPLNNNFSLFINSILFALGKQNITKTEFINDIKHNISYTRYTNLNNGSINYIFNNDISHNTSLTSLVSMQKIKNTTTNTTNINNINETNIKRSYDNFINYISDKLKYIDFEFGIDLLSKIYNINIIIFSYNITNIIQTELLCPLNINNYDFKNKKTVILLQINETNKSNNMNSIDNLYELVIIYNNKKGYNYLFDKNNNYFKRNILEKILKKCELKTTNNTYLQSLLYDNNPKYKQINNSIIKKLNIEYNVVDNYNILIGFIININISKKIFIPINPLIDNINKKKSKSTLLFSSIIYNNKYIHNFKNTIKYLNLLDIQIFKYNNHIILDNLNINIIGIGILSGRYIPIKPISLDKIDINKETIISEIDEYIINNIIYNNNSTNLLIDNKYKNFKINIGKKLNIEKKYKKQLSNSLLTNNIETIYKNLLDILNIFKINIDDNLYIEYLSYELLNNYIVRNEILNYIGDIYEDISLLNNTLILQEKELQDIGLNSIYKSFYFNNNNIYTGNLYNNEILYLNELDNTYDKIILNCNNLVKIEDTNSILYNKYYYKFTIVKQINTIMYYSDCIYYNLSKVIYKNYNIQKLRQEIYDYIIDKNLFKTYLHNVRKETNNLLYNDIINKKQLEYILLSNNHWLTNEDIIIIGEIYNFNILIIDTENNINYHINETVVSNNFIIIYKESFYHKSIYYLLYNENNSIFLEEEILYILEYNKLDNIVSKSEYSITTNNENKYIYDLNNNLFTIINLFEENIINKNDINNIINEFLNIWKILPFKNNTELIKILNKINILKKNLDIYIKTLINFYPGIEINEPILFPPFNHLNSVWELRENKNIYKIFTEIYNSKNLFVTLDSFTVIFNKNNYFKTHTIEDTDNINSFITLTSITLYYINDIEYIQKLKSKFVKINDDEYRINSIDIDTSYIQSITLEPGILFIFSTRLLYLFDIDKFNLSIILHLSYIKQSDSKHSIEERIESFVNGTNINKYLFSQPHYIENDKNRIYNLFDIKIFSDGGLFLYDNYLNFNKESPIIYNNKKKEINQYNPTKVLCNKNNYNEIKLSEILTDTTLDLNQKINTLYLNNNTINNLSEFGQRILIGKKNK